MTRRFKTLAELVVLAAVIVLAMSWYAGNL
jgi:hypothetical protein